MRNAAAKLNDWAVTGTTNFAGHTPGGRLA